MNPFSAVNYTAERCASWCIWHTWPRLDPFPLSVVQSSVQTFFASIFDEIIIPAKIVLRSTLNEALEPIQSNRIRKKKKPVESTGTDGAHADPEGSAW